jgi:endo-1,4-beta-D-glucanase Y
MTYVSRKRLLISQTVTCYFAKIGPSTRRALVFSVLLLLAVVAGGWLPTPVTFASPSIGTQSSNPNIPFPAHSIYAAETLIPNHISQFRQDDLVRGAYDAWKNSYLLPVPAKEGTLQMYRVSAGKKRKNKTYSEGQGYGMILAVYMAGYEPKAQVIFDGLWLFAKNHPRRIDKRFMAYQVPVSKNRRDSSFDGDCDMALAMLLANSQWGSSGRINYLEEALSLIRALMEMAIGKDSKLPMLGDWVKSNGKRYNQYSHRSSDIMPAHFKAFYKATGDKQWQEVVHRSKILIEHMQTSYSPDTGLLPDFMVGSSGMHTNYKPAVSRYLESKYDGQYFYNAARVPWRLSFDALLNNDAVSLVQVKRIAEWAVKKSGGRPLNIRPGYRLNGKRLGNDNYISKAFIAPLGIAAMATGEHQNFVNNIFDLCTTLPQDYYEDTIGLLCLLLMTGNCWLPT